MRLIQSDGTLAKTPHSLEQKQHKEMAVLARTSITPHLQDM